MTWEDCHWWVSADARELRRMRLRMRLQPKRTTDSGEFDRQYLARPRRAASLRARASRAVSAVGVWLSQMASHGVIGKVEENARRPADRCADLGS